MTREEKCLLAIERGFTYNPETGKVYNRYSKELINKHSAGYIDISIKLNKKTYHLLAHHFAWYWIYKTTDFEQLDHINGIRKDNRIKNLRSVTCQKNHFNRSNVKGFTFYKRDKIFIAQICVNDKRIILGRFITEEEAREAYLKAKEKYHVI
jgi:hypothetical protein